MTERQTVLYYEVLGFQASTLAALAERFNVVRLPDPSHDSDEVLRGVHVMFAPLGHAVDAAKLARAPELRTIASATLVVPHIDLRAAVERGVSVCWLGAEAAMLARITATAELAWGLLLSVTRHIPSAHTAAIRGEWGGRPFGRRTPRMLSAMSLGIVGMGRLGRMVATYGAAFGMTVSYFSPTSTDGRFFRCHSLAELAERSDVVSVHAAHTPETAGLIGRSFLRAMPSGSFLINTARGAVIDESALLESLIDGHLAGAGLDALADEYSPGFRALLGEHPLVVYARNNGNLIITPHYGGATLDAWEMVEGRILEQIFTMTSASSDKRRA